MNLLRDTHSIQNSLSLSPFSPPATSFLQNHARSSNTGASFPIIVVAVIGILATAFLLVSYYIFVIKCCLNWHRIDLLRRFNLSSRRREGPLTSYSPAIQSHGLDESVIRSIPVFQYKKLPKVEQKTSFSECPVCLNEFEEDEKLRVIPNCSHFFHIDCIDIWLQNNPNCPLCRTSISTATHFPIISPSSYPPDPIPPSHTHIDQNEDFIVIEVGNNNSSAQNQTFCDRQENPSPTMFRFRSKSKRKLSKVTSMGDEWIDTREKDEQFSVTQPIRRSFSMDSSADRQLYSAIQEALQKNSSAGDCSDRMRRSLFSFGPGRGSKTGVLPLRLAP